MRPHLHRDEQDPEMEKYRTRSYQIVIKIANKKLRLAENIVSKSCGIVRVFSRVFDICTL